MPRQTSSGPHLISTSPSLIKCRKCGQPVMACTVSGMDRHIDPAALTQAGELAVLLSGRATFSLRGDTVFSRTPEKIRSGDRRYPVLPEHRCGATIPEQHLDPVWMEAATAIVIQACGGVVVGKDTIAYEPPF
jgi:hypothetical protein